MKAFSGLYLPWKLRRSGAAFLVMDALILLAAWNTGSNLYYLIASALAAFLAVSLVIVGGSLRGVTLKREVPDGVHRDEPFGVHATIVNTKKFLPSFSIRLERTGVDPASVGLVLAISPRRAVTLTLSERIPRRGLHRLPPIDIVTAFPFGLFERRKRLRDRVEVLVYPRVMALRAFPLDRSAHGGSATRSLRGQGDEFFSLREYVPGDDLRRVAWRVSARFGRPLVKELEHETTRTVMLVLDVRQRPGVQDFEERFEEAIELAASLAVTLLQRQYAVGLVAGAKVLPEDKGKAQVLQVLRLLALLQPSAASDLDPFLAYSGAMELAGRSMVCISPDPASWGMRAGRGDLRVLDPREVVHA